MGETCAKCGLVVDGDPHLCCYVEPFCSPMRGNPADFYREDGSPKVTHRGWIIEDENGILEEGSVRFDDEGVIVESSVRRPAKDAPDKQ